MIVVVVLRLLVLKDSSGMVEMGRNQLTLAGTWGLMAAEELLKELCHFTAAVFDERGLVVSRTGSLSDRNGIHWEDAILLLYRSVWELGGGCSPYVWKPKITYFWFQEENLNTGHLGVKHQQSIRNPIYIGKFVLFQNTFVKVLV